MFGEFGNLLLELTTLCGAAVSGFPQMTVVPALILMSAFFWPVACQPNVDGLLGSLTASILTVVWLVRSTRSVGRLPLWSCSLYAAICVGSVSVPSTYDQPFTFGRLFAARYD